MTGPFSPSVTRPALDRAHLILQAVQHCPKAGLTRSSGWQKRGSLLCRVLRVHHARLWWSVSRQKHRNVVERVFNSASNSGITHALPQGTHHPFFVSLTMHPGDMPQASRRKAAYCRRFAGKKHQALLLNPLPVLLIESYGDKCLAYLLRIIRRQRSFCRHPLKRFHLVELSHG